MQQPESQAPETGAELRLAPGEWATQRVALFVDSQNLFYAARQTRGRNIDYEYLLKLGVRGRHLHFATAYVVEREGESNAYGFVTRLSTLGYRVRRRHVRVHRVDDEGNTIQEGDWDMDIAMDVVRAWDHCDVIVLATGDGDFTPLVQLAQERGKRVEVLAVRATTAQSLIDATDRFIDLDAIEAAFLPAPAHAL